MSKTIYKRSIIESELGFVKTQNFLAQQANRGIESGKRVCRVWTRSGSDKILNEVVVSKG